MYLNDNKVGYLLIGSEQGYVPWVGNSTYANRRSDWFIYRNWKVIICGSRPISDSLPPHDLSDSPCYLGIRSILRTYNDTRRKADSALRLMITSQCPRLWRYLGSLSPRLLLHLTCLFMSINPARRALYMGSIKEKRSQATSWASIQADLPIARGPDNILVGPIMSYPGSGVMWDNRGKDRVWGLGHR